MNVAFCIRTLALLVILLALTSVEARRCRKADRKAGKCLRRDRRDRGKERRSKKNVAPYWRKGPPKDSQIIAREGTDVTLNCAVKGSPHPDIHWLKNNKDLRTKNSKKYRQRRTKLTVKSVVIQDIASYTCIAKNRVGSLNYTFFIKVLENMPLNHIDVEDKPENQTSHVGDTVIFMCRSHDWPKPRVHWARKTVFKKSIEMLETPSNTSDVLVLHNVTKEDSGVYTCHIGNNKVNKELSATLRVIKEGESLPFEPPCSLHVRRTVLVDHAQGCKTPEPVEMHYCMGSCGRSYYVPQMVTIDDTNTETHLNQTCRCCVGVVDSLRIVELDCPLGTKKRGFYTLLRACQCQGCNVQNELSPKPKGSPDSGD